MASFTPTKRIQLEALWRAGMRVASELARQFGCYSRTVERELDRCAGRAGKCSKSYQTYYAGQNRQACAERSAANVVVKAQGELLMQLYGLFDEPLRLSPEGVSLIAVSTAQDGRQRALVAVNARDLRVARAGADERSGLRALAG